MFDHNLKGQKCRNSICISTNTCMTKISSENKEISLIHRIRGEIEQKKRSNKTQYRLQ